MKSNFKKIIAYILRIESILVLWKYKPKIVAITGSIGKTSTKDAVYAVISKFAHVRKSQKSFNSQIGLPLTILGCPNGWDSPLLWLENILKGLWLFIWPHKYPKWLVLEVGIGGKGDMKKTAGWLKTDVVIMTAIGDTPAHIEFFDSRDELIEEKKKLIKTLKKEGLLVLNRDDEAIYKMKEKSKHKTITYGFKEGADILGSEDSIYYGDNGEPNGVIFRIDQDGKSLPVIIEGVFGKNHIYAALASFAVLYGEKLNMLSGIDALKSYDMPPSRMRLLKGIADSIIIDDTYNSSPFACESGIKTLGQIKNGRKIAVLGDMLELGKHTKEAHENIGKIASENVDILIVVGSRAESIKVGAIEVGMKEKNILEFTNSKEAGEFLKTFVKKGDVVFMKGSQGMRMERAVEAILWDDKENLPAGRQVKNKLLCRQDKEWLAKA